MEVFVATVWIPQIGIVHGPPTFCVGRSPWLQGKTTRNKNAGHRKRVARSAGTVNFEVKLLQRSVSPPLVDTISTPPPTRDC